MDEQTTNIEPLLQNGYRYALSLTHDSQLAEDLLQTACLKISRKGGPWDIRYLITTLRNAHIDNIRRAGKLDFYPIDDEDLVGDVDMMLSSFDPELESALAQLQDDVRELLYLSVVEDYTVTELAELTQRPRGTILSILHRTKKNLRALLSSSPISNRNDPSSSTGGVRQ